MLDVQKLCFDYTDIALLKNSSFSLKAGQILHLQGSNGSGKTSLLRLLAGILQPLSGAIFWQGKNINENLAAFQKELCYVGHKPGFSLHLSLRENAYFDLHSSYQKKNIDSALAEFNLLALADYPCFMLSEGQRKRLALMRLFMTEASLWLLDEPLVALDASALSTLSTCLKKHRDKGGLIIMSSHQPLPQILGPHRSYNL